MIRIWKLALEEWQGMLLASFLAFLATGSSIGLMYCSGYVLTYASFQPSIAVLAVPIVALRAFGLSRGIFRWADRIKSHDTALRLLERFRIWFYQKLEPLVPAGLRHIRQGDLLQALARDVDSLEFLYARVVSPPLIAFWTSLLMAILLGSTSWKMFLAFLFFQGISIIASLSLLPFLRTQATKARSLAASMQEIAMDIHQGKQQIRFAGTEAVWNSHFLDIEKLHSLAIHKLSVAIGLAEALLVLLTSLATIAVGWIGAPMVMEGSLRPFEWVALILATWAAMESVQGFPAMAHALQQSKAAATRLLSIADTPQIPLPAPIQQAQQAVVKWENLGFRWPDGDFLFRNWSGKLHPGRTYALTGASGCGKSTLAHILSQLLPPTEGELVWENGAQPNSTSLLDQNPHFFTGTISDNLRLADSSLSEFQMKEVLQHVGLDRANPWIGEQGKELSGGQRQRLAAARILLRSSRLVILDEPAAHLDSSAEEEILKLFCAQAKSRPFALLVITHRPQFLPLFDEILKLPGN